jgi:DNA-binding IclR family transcriptional regulator
MGHRIEADMADRLVATLAVLRAVADRPDPTEPVTIGRIAAGLRLELSRVSRMCAELADENVLLRAPAYGSYALGARAIALSGSTAAPFAQTIRFALTRAAQDTTETVFLAVPQGEHIRVVDAVESGWTLHASAVVGERLTQAGRAAVEAARGRTADATGIFETRDGRTAEIAVAVAHPLGGCLAVIGVRMPVYRLARTAPHARRAARAAARAITHAYAQWLDAGIPLSPHPGSPAPVKPLSGCLALLEALAPTVATAGQVARAVGMRVDRAQRLIDAAVRAGLATGPDDLGRYGVHGAIHAWFRASIEPILTGPAAVHVRHAAEDLGVCTFLTALRGMRSVTLVEELTNLGEGLQMTPWLGRPHPIVGSDGGPTLIMDFTREQLATVFPTRHTTSDFDLLADRMERVRAAGVLTIHSLDEWGMTSVSAPVRGPDGLVAAAACVVGTTDIMRARIQDYERATVDLAAAVSVHLR